MVSQTDIVIGFIRDNGPVLPVQVAKKVKTEILFASAMLSEMVSRKKLKMSHAAIGGSPLYYLPGQEIMLGEKLYKSLKEKEKEGYDLLKEEKVIWEKEAEPWQRIAFKNLKDFAVPLNVKVGDSDEIFWKFHLITEEEAKKRIGEIIGNKEKTEEKVEEKEVEVKVVKQEVKVEETQDKIKKEILETLREDLMKELKKEVEAKKTKEKQTVLKKKVKKVDDGLSGEFYSKILEFFKRNEIKLVKAEMIKKNKEFDFYVDIPSHIGELRYFVKAKDKKKLTDADVFNTYSEGQIRKLPTLLVGPGKLSKKTEELISKKFKGQLIFMGM